MSRWNRNHTAQQRQHVLDVAVSLAKRTNYSRITREQIAEAAEVSVGTVSNHFKNMDGLRAEIMLAAIAQELPELVAQGLANGDRIVQNAPRVLKARAANLLLR